MGVAGILDRVNKLLGVWGRNSPDGIEFSKIVKNDRKEIAKNALI